MTTPLNHITTVIRPADGTAVSTKLALAVLLLMAHHTLRPDKRRRR
jgi:hypothetical protein